MKRVVLCFAVLVGACAWWARQAPPPRTQGPPMGAQAPAGCDPGTAGEPVVRRGQAGSRPRRQQPAEDGGEDAGRSLRLPAGARDFAPLPARWDTQSTRGMRTCAGITGSGTQLGASKMTAKAELVAAMKSSIAECDKAFAGLTDAGVVQTRHRGARGSAIAPGGPLYGMVAHDNEEYGYLAVHLRLKGSCRRRAKAE